VDGDSGTLLRCIYELSHDGEHCAPMYMHWITEESGNSAFTRQEVEAYAKEGWDWLGEALAALGVKDVFEMRARYPDAQETARLRAAMEARLENQHEGNRSD
jgi:hypothetical protein